MLLKCCTQYISKFGKLSRGHRTGKGQFSFQSQRKTIPKNVQTTIQSFHVLARSCSKYFKLGFSSIWTKNFQMYKLGFKEVEEPEIKLPAFIGSRRKQGSFRKTSSSASLTMLKPLCGSQQTVETFLKRWQYQIILPGSWGNSMHGKKQQLELDVKQLTGSKLGKECIKAVYCHPTYLTYKQSISCEVPGWINHKLESRLPQEISTTSDMQMIPS